jgi:outer membrane receptor protein involved in Fe transport
MRIKTFRRSIPASIICAFLFLVFPASLQVKAQANQTRKISGTVVTDKNETVAAVSVIARYAYGERKTITGEDGYFELNVPDVRLTLRVEGKNIAPVEKALAPGEAAEKIQLRIKYIVPPVHESMVIVATALDPNIDRRDDATYRNSLFSRDDQVFHTLNAGINAGQHEGGGKSLEIRRFGFNLDHGGVSGGLKVLVDGVQQNQGTQGHGQGYLGQLKSLTPELVQEVSILNGPFSAEYGDFSGLGVVHIRLRESLPEQLTVRLQGGSFDTFRTFLAYSPELKRAQSFIAYEGSRTDGPFKNPLRYKRDNITGNYTRRLGQNEALGIKLNAGRNDFFSSGQLPLDEVAAGRLDRFGFLDPFNGGRVQSAVFGVYYRKEWDSGDILKLDGFVSRSLFDLYSNFTFFLNDEVNGDEIQQHDSRLQEGINAQYLRPYSLLGQRALLTLGGNFHGNQINVGLNQTVRRNPINVFTKANAHVTNAAGYLQQAIDLFGGRLHLDGGLRYDYFKFDVQDRVAPAGSGTHGASRLQPKANLAYTPSSRWPLTLYFDYGRGISSQDARGVVQRPSAPRISTTDFYQLGLSHHLKRFSLSADLFLIDRSNEQVYIPDDGSFEFKGPSRSYGGEVKSSVQVTRHVAFNAGMTRVGNAFFRGTAPRLYLDSAPHFAGNAALTLANWRGFSGSLRYRHISSYRLDGEDTRLRASGLDVLDLSVARKIRRWLDFNLSIDNLTDKRYFETQNYFESRLRPGDPVIARIHATPGYPITVTAGLTFRFLGK